MFNLVSDHVRMKPSASTTKLASTMRYIVTHSTKSFKMQDDYAEKIQLLQGLMGDLDAETAREVLMKHNGDIEAAATAMLDTKERAEPRTAWIETSGFDDVNMSSSSATTTQIPRRTNTPRSPERILPAAPAQDNRTVGQPSGNGDIIDLTGEFDDTESDLARALAMSFEQPRTLQSSNMEPDPNWAMVPSNVC